MDIILELASRIVDEVENEMERRGIMPKKYPATRYSDVLYGCGVCKHEFPQGKPNYCPNCGKRADWRGK